VVSKKRKLGTESRYLATNWLVIRLGLEPRTY